MIIYIDWILHEGDMLMLECPLCNQKLTLEDNFTDDEDSNQIMYIIGTCYDCNKMISFKQKNKKEEVESIEELGCNP